MQKSSTSTDNLTMAKKIFKWTITIFFIFFVCTLASAKGKGDAGFIEDNVLEVAEETGETTSELAEETAEQEDETEEIEIKEPVQLYTLRPVEGKPVGFAETWGYVCAGREDEYDSSLPITDVCYFSAEINCYGHNTSCESAGSCRCKRSSKYHR